MAFATLEEAWGMPSQPAAISQTAWALTGPTGDSKQQSRLGIDNPMLGQLVGGQPGNGGGRNGSNGGNGGPWQGNGGGGSRGGRGSGGRGGRGGGDGGRGSGGGNNGGGGGGQLVPSPSDANAFFNDGDESTASMEARRYLARAYAHGGVAGIIRALPPQAQLALASRTFKARKERSWSAYIMDFLRSPEKVLLVLLVAFALLVLYDTRRQSAMDLSALHHHVTPFPMMPGMTLTTS